MKKERRALIAGTGPVGLRNLLDTFARRTRRSRANALIYLVEKALAQESIVQPAPRPTPPGSDASQGVQP